MRRMATTIVSITIVHCLMKVPKKEEQYYQNEYSVIVFLFLMLLLLLFLFCFGGKRVLQYCEYLPHRCFTFYTMMFKVFSDVNVQMSNPMYLLRKVNIITIVGLDIFKVISNDNEDYIIVSMKCQNKH